MNCFPNCFSSLGIYRSAAECRWPDQPPQREHGATERAETHPWQRFLFVEGVLGFDGRLPGAVSEKSAT